MPELPEVEVVRRGIDAWATNRTISRVDGNKVDLSYRPVITDPLTTEDQGGISLKTIAPKARTF